MPYLCFKKYPFVIISKIIYVCYYSSKGVSYRGTPVQQRSVLFHNSAFEVLGEVHAGLLRGVVRGHFLHVVAHH